MAALKVRRPPDPRIASLRYARWARAVSEAWRAYVLAHPEASRAELEQAWANLTDRDQWARFFDVLAQVNENAAKQYYVKLFKRPQPRPSNLPSVRAAWVDTQFELLGKLGADQIDRLMRARATHTGRTDAQRKTPEGFTHNYTTAELEQLPPGTIVIYKGAPATFLGRTSRAGMTAARRAAAEKAGEKIVGGFQIEQGGKLRSNLGGLSIQRETPVTLEAASEMANAALLAKRAGLIAPTAPASVVARAALDPIAAARAENIALIKGTTEAQRASLGGLFKNAQAVGQRHETLVDEVQSILDIGRTRAKLIARDQTVKHNAAVNQAQAEASGVREYTWRITRDMSCRPMHRALEGTVHRYDQPPITNKEGDRNNPGEDYNCRCQAEPKISQAQDLFAGLADPEFSGGLGF